MQIYLYFLSIFFAFVFGFYVCIVHKLIFRLPSILAITYQFSSYSYSIIAFVSCVDLFIHYTMLLYFFLFP